MHFSALLSYNLLFKNVLHVVNYVRDDLTNSERFKSQILFYNYSMTDCCKKELINEKCIGEIVKKELINEKCIGKIVKKELINKKCIGEIVKKELINKKCIGKIVK